MLSPVAGLDSDDLELHVVRSLARRVAVGGPNRTATPFGGRIGHGLSLTGSRQRLEILRRLLDPSTGSLEHRVAAMMLVLLGQPFTRTAALTLFDVVVEGEESACARVQALHLFRHRSQAWWPTSSVGRPTLNTASNPKSPFLFPGRSADKPLLPSTLRSAAIQMGIDITGARTGALRQLVLDCPPPVVAEPLATATKRSTDMRSMPVPLGVPTQRCERQMPARSGR